jgi:hypothetical protein
MRKKRRVRQESFLEKKFHKGKMYKIIKEMREAGSSTQQIANQLNSEGWTTKTGKPIIPAYTSLIFNSYRQKRYGKGPKNMMPEEPKKQSRYEDVMPPPVLKKDPPKGVYNFVTDVVNSNLNMHNKLFLLSEYGSELGEFKDFK